MMLKLSSNYEGHVLHFFHCEERKTWYAEESMLKAAMGLDDVAFAKMFNDAEYRVFESKKTNNVYYLIPLIDVYLTQKKSPLALWIHDEEFIYLPRRLYAKKGVIVNLLRRLETTMKHLDRSLSLYGKEGAKYYPTILKTAENLEEKVHALKEHGLTPQNDLALQEAFALIEEARRYDERKAKRP